MRALHIAGHPNVGADLMSRGGPRRDDWSLHPQIMEFLRACFGRAEVDLFASRENVKCPLWYSLAPQDNPPLGTQSFARALWPGVLLYALGGSIIRRGRDSHHSGAGQASDGLAAERLRLSRRGLSPAVISTIQSARASSTVKLHSSKWAAFACWCDERDRASSVYYECMPPLSPTVTRASRGLRSSLTPWSEVF